MNLILRSKLITAPTVEPVTFDEFSHHARLIDLVDETVSDEEDYVESLITLARNWCEDYTGRAFITQTWDFYMQDWPAGDYIEIPKPTLSGISYIRYYGTDDTEYTLSASTEYSSDLISEPGRVVLRYNQSWPSTSLRPSNPICIRAICGYGDAATDVPTNIKHAIKMLASHFYENREKIIVGRIVSDIPSTVEYLLDMYKVVFI